MTLIITFLKVVNYMLNKTNFLAWLFINVVTLFTLAKVLAFFMFCASFLLFFGFVLRL